MFLLLLAGATVVYVCWTWTCLELNVRTAASLNVPYVRLPVDSNNILWMIFEPHLWKIVDALPLKWAAYPASIRYLRRGWHFSEKAASHTRLGPVWALVSPVRIDLYIADPDAIGDVFARRRDFVRPIANYSQPSALCQSCVDLANAEIEVLEVFGPCISTADVSNWPRHRKALAAPFNETIMSFVWDEALRESKSMVTSWSSPSVTATGVPSVQSDTRSMSLNILAATGFRKSYEFIPSTDAEESEADSYRHALQIVLDNAILLMLMPYRVLKFPLMPKSWARIGRAAEAFKGYMLQMLDEEMKALKQGTEGSGGIMTSLVHALDAYQNDVGTKELAGESAGTLTKGLSVPEIFGNIFVINFAGHDTTANTLAFSMLLLANKPEIQNWASQEIKGVVKDGTLIAGTYNELFPRLLRCRAILYETLRLYPPIMALPKGTDHRTQKLTIRGHTLVVPPNTGTTLSILACHTNPDTWTNPLTWDPKRWIVASPGGEEFYTPPPNTYFPWSDGPQNCPGKKFAEVEFVAALACLLSNHRVRIKLLAGETVVEAQRRVSDTINDVNMELLLRMKDADRVRLVCVSDQD